MDYDTLFTTSGDSKRYKKGDKVYVPSFDGTIEEATITDVFEGIQFTDGYTGNGYNAYWVEIKNGALKLLSDDELDKYNKKRIVCQCGAHKTNQPKHSEWCDVFSL